MRALISFLKRIKLMPAITQADIDEAGDADVKLSAEKNALSRSVATANAELSFRANDALREAVTRVRSSSAFAEFERSVRRDR